MGALRALDGSTEGSATGTRARVARARAEYPNQRSVVAIDLRCLLVKPPAAKTEEMRNEATMANVKKNHQNKSFKFPCCLRGLMVKTPPFASSDVSGNRISDP